METKKLNWNRNKAKKNYAKIEKNQTIINFTVEFEFKRFLHQKFAEAFFPLIEKKMIESFKKRADSLLN